MYEELGSSLAPMFQINTGTRRLGYQTEVGHLNFAPPP